MSDAELVAEFTSESGTPVPNSPQLMSKDDVFFLIKMMLDEIMEFGATVAEPLDVKFEMIKMITGSKDIPKCEGSTEELIAEQADALVDSYYYSLNAAAKKGINLSKIFKLVHEANMDKRDPVTGKFIRREDGKIIKPPGWANKWDSNKFVVQEILRQIKEGSFMQNITKR